MGLLSSIVNQIRRTASKAVAAVAGFGGRGTGGSSGASKSSSGGGKSYVLVSVKQDKHDYIESLVQLTKTGAIKEAMAEQIGELLLKEMKSEASKFRDKGDLVNSLTLIKLSPGRFIIDSDLPYKETWIRSTDQGVPSTIPLLEWMKRKPDFNDAFAQGRAVNIAFAIQNSFIPPYEGADATGRSTLRNLNEAKTGSRERMYDYRKYALENIDAELRNLGAVFEKII